MSNIQQLLIDFDTSQSTIDIALDTIYLINKYRVDPKTVSFDYTTVLGTHDYTSGYPNTALKVWFKSEYNYLMGGDQKFLSIRLPLNLLQPTTDEPIIPASRPYSFADIVDDFNELYNCKLTVDDILPLSYTGDSNVITLIAHPNSLAWINAIEVKVRDFSIPPLFTDIRLNDFKKYTQSDNTDTPYLGDSVVRFIRILSTVNTNEVIYTQDYTLGEVRANTGPNSGIQNTRIDLLSVDEEQFSNVAIFYNRLSINVLNDLPDGMITDVEVPSLPTTTHELLDNINTALNLNLTPEEVVNEVYEDANLKLPLTITDSIAWIPNSTYMFKINLLSGIQTEDLDYLTTEDNKILEVEY